MRTLPPWQLPLWLLAAAACIESPTPPSPPATTAQALGSPGTAVILGAPWEHRTIRVCWTQGAAPMSSLEAAALADDLDWLEPMIRAAWEPTVGVTWDFTRDCVSGYDVALDVWGDHGLGWGRALRDAPPLGVDLRDYGEAPTDRHARLRAEALRASGRVLGLEWVAADEGEACATPFRRGCADDSPLAPTAVRAAVTLYGPGHHRMITPTGQCLMAAQNRDAVVGDCGSGAHAWLDRLAGRGHTVYHDGGYVGVLGRGPAEGPLRFPPTGAGRFALHAQIGVAGGACLVAHADEPAPRLAPCDEDANHPRIYRLPLGSSEVCMVPVSPTPGALVVNTTCDAPYSDDPEHDDNTAWFMWADGTLRYVSAVVPWAEWLCLTPADLGPVGSLLTLEPCQGLTRQHFMLHAAIDEHDDLGARYGIDAPMTEVEVPTPIGEAAPVGVAPVEHRRFTFRSHL